MMNQCRYFLGLSILALSLLGACQKVEDTQSDFFVKFLGNSGTDQPGQVIQNSDGGFTLVGTLMQGDQTTDILLVRTDARGNELWRQTFGGDFDDQGGGLALLDDGGYLVSGTYMYEGDSTDLYAFRTDASGVMQWDTLLGGTADQVGNAALLAADGSMIVAGYTTAAVGTNPLGRRNMLIYKLSADGSTIIWSQTYGTPGDDECNRVAQMSNSNFVMVGTSDQPGTGQSGRNMIAVEIGNAAGVVASNNTYGANGDDFGFDVVTLADGGLLLVGSFQNETTLDENLFAVRVGSSVLADVDWEVNFGTGSQDRALGCSTTLDANQFWVVGFSRQSGPQQMAVYRLDGSGGVINSRTLGGTAGDDAGVDVLSVSGDGAVILGQSGFEPLNKIITLTKVNSSAGLE